MAGNMGNGSTSSSAATGNATAGYTSNLGDYFHTDNMKEKKFSVAQS